MHGPSISTDTTKRKSKTYLIVFLDDASVQVVHQGKFIEQARQVDLYANCFVKRHRRTGVLDVDRKPGPPVTKFSMKSLDSNSNSTGNDTGNSNQNNDQGGRK